MNLKLNYFVLFLASITLGAGSALAQIQNVDADSYQDLVDNLCHASLVYELTDSLKVAKNRYHKFMGECFFPQAITRSQNDLNTEFETKLDQLGSRIELQDLDWEPPQGCQTLEELFMAQKNTPKGKGYQTECDSETSSVKENYSACRITEVALNESCAYRQYLNWRLRDPNLAQTIIKEGEGVDAVKFDQRVNEALAAFNIEYEKSIKLLNETLKQYQAFQEGYRLHLNWEVTKAWLQKIIVKSDFVRQALGRWPYKFHDSNSAHCDWSCIN